MITAIEITARAPFVGGAAFGATGAYERLDGIAIGELDPTHPANRGIVNVDKAPRNARGMVEYRSDICILRPADPERGNGRILYEVNNRGRMMLFANLCAGKAGNQPSAAADLGNALPLRRGFTLLWSRLGPGRATCQWRTWAGRADRHRQRRADRAAHPRGIHLRHARRRSQAVPPVL